MKILGSINDSKSIVSKEYVDNGLSGKAPLSHTQAINTIIGLEAKLDELQSKIDALEAKMDTKVDKGTTVTITAGQVKL